MTSLPLLPPAYCPDDSLPDYRQSLQLNRSPAYASLTLIPTQGSTSTQAISISSGFFFESKRLTLDLGPRQWSPQLPVYGRNGLIEGHVGIKSFNRVDRVEVGVSWSHILLGLQPSDLDFSSLGPCYSIRSPTAHHRCALHKLSYLKSPRYGHPTSRRQSRRVPFPLHSRCLIMPPDLSSNTL